MNSGYPGKWVNIRGIFETNDLPYYVYTRQDESPYPIVVSQIVQPPPKGNPNFTLERRRAVIASDAGASLVFDFYPILVSSVTNENYQIPFKSHSLLDSTQLNLKNFFEYLGTDTAWIPQNASRLQIKWKSFVVNSDDSTGQIVPNIFQDNFRIQLHLIDLDKPSMSSSSNLNASTMVFNISNHAGHRMLIRPELQLTTAALTGLKVGMGNIYSPSVTSQMGKSLAMENSELQISQFVLKPAYPNPFNPSTTIAFLLSSPNKVKLEIYDTMGQHIKTLISGNLPAVEHSYRWQANEYASGVYFYRLQVGPQIYTQKILLMK